MTKRAFVVVAAVMAMLVATGGAAHAVPTPPPGPSTGNSTSTDLITSIIRRDAPQPIAPKSRQTGPDADSAGPSNENSAELLHRANHQASATGSETPRAVGPRQALPAVAITDCQDEPFSVESGGFVVDHYRFCQVSLWDLELQLCKLSLPLIGCAQKKVIGRASFRLTTIGYGWDGTMDSRGTPNPAYSQIEFVSALDQWKVTGAGATMQLDIGLKCSAQVPAFCLGLPDEQGASKPVAEWQADPGAYIRFFSDPADGTGRDKVRWYDFDTNLKVTPPAGAGIGDSQTIGGSGFRCDDATYLVGKRGCVFDHTSELFTLPLESTANWRKAALHIYDAFFRPDRTQPQVPGKEVPGNISVDKPRPLHRIYEPYDPRIVSDNHAQAVRTCVDWWGPDYAQGGQFDCDEYPFKSTYQGASQSNGNYSARVIDMSDNRSAGGKLSAWYESDRILHDDPFYVVLTRPKDDPDAPADLPPTVSAGPDVTGYEGSPIPLLGSASNLSGPVAAHWDYQIVASAKPGMSCAISNAESATTYITCNDDGVVRVTLTGNDGMNAPVSDSATVTVLNAAPDIDTTEQTTTGRVATADAAPTGSLGPQPWQVFRAGSAVSLSMAFTDPGAIDTHTCNVNWDDGTPESYPAQSRRCDREHTFQHAGMYSIHATVVDDGDLIDTFNTLIVVYDPKAGFDNADGSFQSPAGAWTAQPAATGQLNFHLTGRYYNDTSPTGIGKVYLANTDLRFDGDANGLEWLVVTPDGKVAAKGTGTINNQGRYGFVFYGYDGCAGGLPGQCQPGPDRFRVVLWPLSSGAYPGENTLYDNRASAGYDVDVADPQPIGTGEVRIHPPTGG